MPWDYSTWQPFSTSHPPRTVPNDGAHGFYNSGSTQTTIPTPTFLPPIRSTSNFSSTPTTHNDATTSMAIAMWAPPRSAYPAENTTAEQNSNSWPRLLPFQPNSPFATGTQPIPSPSFPPSTSPPTQTMTKPGSTNICTCPAGNLHSTGLTSHSASSSKQTAGNSADTEHISFHAWPQSLPPLSKATPTTTFHSPTHTSHITQASRPHRPTRPHQTHTRASFDAARQLRSGKYTDLEVYAIRRMATSLEEPGRSRALHLLNQALTYRNLTPPKSNLPLTIPFLAHPSFQSDVQRWLGQLINHHKHFAIPLHLPTCRVREAAHPTLRSRLRNRRRWETLLGSPPHINQLPCGWAHLRTLVLPTSQFPDDDHLIVTLADLQLPVHLRRFLNADMNTALSFRPNIAISTLFARA